MASVNSAAATVDVPSARDSPQELNGDVQWSSHNAQPNRKTDVLSAATCSNAGPLQKKIKAKRKNDSLSVMLCAAIVKHQLGLSINCLLLLALTHMFFPSLRHRTIHYFTLSYRDPETALYTQGWDDLKLVSCWIIIFTALRAATMDYLLLPFAKCAGISKKKAIVRFAEQAWMLIYYCISWPLGFYLVYQSKYYFNIPAVWEDFPTRSMTGLLKWYYLVQFAFWLQQILVVNIEERRKDHWQMFTHHIITCALMLFSYGYYQTKVGNVILCLMDFVDIILPAAKLLKYAGYQTLCDIMFAVFIASWFVTRHIFYNAVCWSIYVDVPRIMHYGCYDAVTGTKTSSDGGNMVIENIMHAYTESDSDVCFNEQIHYGFLGLLLSLQVVTIIWFGMICRVAYSVIMGKPADDSRSDDEGEDDEEVEDEEDDIHDFAEKTPELGYMRYQEVEVEAEDMEFVQRSTTAMGRRRSGDGGVVSASGGTGSGAGARRRRSKMGGRSSGISIPGAASDHKELLGRIGCDKPN